MKVLRIAYSRFKGDKDFESFKEENKFWLDDYTLYMSVKQKFDLKSWHEWDDDIKHRTEDSIKKYKITI